MHVYLKEDPVEIEMREVEADGLVPEDSELIPVAFYVVGNQRPSFRAILPPSTVAVLEEATLEPVRLGLLAEEPESPEQEIQAMVGLSVTMRGSPEGHDEDGDEEEERAPADPWSTDPDAWKQAAEEEDEEESEGAERTVLLAFAPLVRLRRKFPHDFAEELADLLETALAGETRPALEARVDDILGGL